ncbi:MAG: DUF4258 domain-containing protein [Rhodospirillales bacterium]|nr:DUF4258 domain-containing protein [Rhodospirillales bacterium]
MATSVVPVKYLSQYRNFFRDFPNFNIRLTRHARIRMKERDIRLPQVRTILMTGSLVHVEPDIRTGLDKYRVAGSDADGRQLEVVASLDETGSGRVVVITAIDTSDAGSGDRRPQRGGGKGRATEADDGSNSDLP